MKRYLKFCAIIVFISSPLIDAPADASDLTWSTFLGGGSTDRGIDVVVDATGNTYVAGFTYSQDFPKVYGSYDTTYNGGVSDAFVAKLNPMGSALVYATFLGGGDEDVAYAIAVDDGEAYVTGYTYSSDFPSTPGSFDSTYDGPYDGFVVKLSASGDALDYATFLGGSSSDYGNGIAVDGSGNAYVTGDTYSDDFPTTDGAYDTSFNDGISDAFVAKLNPMGSSLVYATFLGGGDEDAGYAVVVDYADDAYVTGATGSTDFPTTPDAYDTSFNGWDDVFVVRLNPTGSVLDYATFLGGTGTEVGRSIAGDGSGNVYVTGSTGSSDFPTTPGAYDETHNNGFDAFVFKLGAMGSLLYYSTILGGSDYDRGDAIAVDDSGSAYVTGRTRSADFPTTSGAFDTTYNGDDAMVVKLNPTGTTLVYATFLGSGWGFGIDVDDSSNAYVTGHTGSSGFPTTWGSYDTTFNGVTDAFVAELHLPWKAPIDSVAPARVVDLAVSRVTGASATLVWTAPGDDGTTGTAHEYDLRFAETPVGSDTAAWWDGATPTTGEPSPSLSGTIDSCDVENLSSETAYYFVVRTADEVPNWSAFSNVAMTTTDDVLAPAAISDLAVSRVTGASATLVWTAPGDDGTTGTASVYDLRYSLSPVGIDTVGWWNAAEVAAGEPDPSPSGTVDSCTVQELISDTTYYFVIRAGDEVPNWSVFSNVAVETTTVSVEEGDYGLLPASYGLSQNHPNPFNPKTRIDYALPEAGRVRLTVCDILGRRVATLVDKQQSAGYQSIQWDASYHPSGIYFCRLQVGEHTITKRMVLLR